MQRERERERHTHTRACARAHTHTHTYIYCVCVRERERETERQTDSERRWGRDICTDAEREREMDGKKEVEYVRQKKGVRIPVGVAP